MPIFGFVQIFNPPYVPTPDEELARTDIARAWAGGNRGRAIIDKFLPQVCLTGQYVLLCTTWLADLLQSFLAEMLSHECLSSK